MRTYRDARDITPDEWLKALTNEPQKQRDILAKLGGDPKDQNYAYLSFLTTELRQRGVEISSSRSKGIWLTAPGEQPSVAPYYPTGGKK